VLQRLTNVILRPRNLSGCNSYFWFHVLLFPVSFISISVSFLENILLCLLLILICHNSRHLTLTFEVAQPCQCSWVLQRPNHALLITSVRSGELLTDFGWHTSALGRVCLTPLIQQWCKHKYKQFQRNHLQQPWLVKTQSMTDHSQLLALKATL